MPGAGAFGRLCRYCHTHVDDPGLLPGRERKATLCTHHTRGMVPNAVQSCSAIAQRLSPLREVDEKPSPTCSRTPDSMTWSTYVAAIRFEGRHWFFLDRVDDDHMLSPDNGVIRHSSGRFALYDSEAAARAAAQRLHEPHQDKSPHITDIDAMLAWCAAPKLATLDPCLAMQAWHQLIDFGVCDDFPDAIRPEEPGYELAVVVAKTHVSYAATDPVWWGRPAPEWTDSELSLLAQTLNAGIRRLAAEVIPALVRHLPK